MRRPHFALLIAIACTPPAPTEPSIAVEIPALSVVIDVPPRTVATHTADGADLVTRPGARVARRITLHASPATAGDRHARLTLDLAVRYTLETGDGGSGGAEANIRGVLELGSRRLAFTCEDQGEPADPTWCLPWLATIRPTPATP